jgi:hypothetical protein
MLGIGNLFVRPVIIAAAVLATSATDVLSSPTNCERLESLARQYAGVQLTSQQQQLKRRLVAWYNVNCKRVQNARS